jgi:5,10-methylenetetrahydrofolate reductase
MSALQKKLASGHFVVTSELNPPKGVDLSALLDSANQLKPLVDAINLTDSHSSRMSLTPLAAAHQLIQTGVEPIMQMTTRDRNRIALQGDMLGAHVLGIRNLVCMGGDPPHLGDHPNAKPVFDLATNELIVAANELNAGRDYAGNAVDGNTEFHIGAVVNPGADNLDLEIARMEEKVTAGAVFFQTQAIYDTDKFASFMERVSPLNVSILAGILPVKSVRMARHMNEKVPGISIPDHIIKAIDQATDVRETSSSISASIIRELATLCQGIHLMTLGWEDQIPRILALAEIDR